MISVGSTITCTLHIADTANKQSLVVSTPLVIRPYTYTDTLNTKFNYMHHSEGFDRFCSIGVPTHHHTKAVSVLIALIRLGLRMHDA